MTKESTDHRRTIFIDVDGVLLYQDGDHMDELIGDSYILPGVLQKLREWDQKDYYICLTTHRPLGMKHITRRQLESVGIVHYDYLLMGLPPGQRFMINNDIDNEPGAIAFSIELNTGLGEINI